MPIEAGQLVRPKKTLRSVRPKNILVGPKTYFSVLFLDKSPSNTIAKLVVYLPVRVGLVLLSLFW